MTGARVTVTNAATLIVGPADDAVWRTVVANRGAIAVYLGGSAVAANAGFQLDPGQSIGWDLNRGDALYGITASSTCVVHYLVGEA